MLILPNPIMMIILSMYEQVIKMFKMLTFLGSGVLNIWLGTGFGNFLVVSDHV